MANRNYELIPGAAALPPALPRPPAQVVLAPAPAVEQEPESPPTPLSHYLWIIRCQKWRILTFIVACVAGTYLISNRLTPIYEATAVVDIDRMAPSGVIGEESSRTGLLNDSDQFLATQLKLLQADSVLRPVAERYSLLERENQFEGNGGGLSKDRVAQAPVLLKQLKVSRPPSTYLLLISYRSTDPVLAANVANDVANSYLEHTYKIRIRSSASLSRFMEKQLDELKVKMENSSSALLRFERELNVINPEERTSILTARLLQLNTEYTNAEADRVKKQSALQTVQSGSLEAAQISSWGEPLARLQEKLNESRQRFADASMTYGANHPAYRKAAGEIEELERQFQETKKRVLAQVQTEYQQALSREQMLAKAVRETKTEFDQLNSRSFDYKQIKQEADADKQLYDELVHRIREAGINAGFQNNSIRLADPARPSVTPVFPNLKLNLGLAFLLSTILALGAAILSDSLDNTVRDPEHLARVFSTEVMGTLPAVKSQAELSLALPSGDGPSESMSLVRMRNASSHNLVVSTYDEAIRSLRNSILLTDFDRRIRSVLFTSPSPGEGKSTTAVRLAASHAEQMKKTLLIDADLRRPVLHQKLSIQMNVGLSNVLLGETSWNDAVVTVPDLPYLDIITAGPPSRRAADQLGAGIEELLEQAGKTYDLIIVDAPPLLGFSETLQIARVVDGVLVLVRAGQTDRKSVGKVLNLLSRLRANTLGLVINHVSREMGDHYHYYGYSSKYYKSYRLKDTA